MGRRWVLGSRLRYACCWFHSDGISIARSSLLCLNIQEYSLHGPVSHLMPFGSCRGRWQNSEHDSACHDKSLETFWQEGGIFVTRKPFLVAKLLLGKRDLPSDSPCYKVFLEYRRSGVVQSVATFLMFIQLVLAPKSQG